MSLPSGITLRNVSLGRGVVMESGVDLSLRVRVKASRDLVWSATGTPVRTIQTTFNASPGEEVIFPLPVTDQAGWMLNGELVDVTGGNQSHTYTVEVDFILAGVKSSSTAKLGPFALPTGDLSTVDLDTLVPAPTGGGATIAIPDAWSDLVAEAQAAAVAAQAAAPRVVRSKNDTGQGTNATVDGAVIPGCTVIVPPTNSEVELTWGAAWAFTAISQGVISVGPYEFTEGLTGAGVVEVESRQVFTNSPVTQAGPIVRGSCWIDPSDVTRVFALAVTKAYDGGDTTLDAYVRNDTDEHKSWIAARY